eukprot:gene27601-7238_t
MQKSRAWSIVRQAVREKRLLDAITPRTSHDGTPIGLDSSATASPRMSHPTYPERSIFMAEYHSAGSSPEVEPFLYGNGEASQQFNAALEEMNSHRGTLKGDLIALKQIVFHSPINILLVCLPLCLLSQYLGWGAVPTFTLSFFSLIPLALILGDITE